MFIFPLGLYLLDASSMFSTSCGKKNLSRHCERLPRGKVTLGWKLNLTHILYSTNAISAYPWKGPFYTIRQSWEIHNAIWPILQNFHGPVKLSWVLPSRPWFGAAHAVDEKQDWVCRHFAHVAGLVCSLTLMLDGRACLLHYFCFLRKQSPDMYECAKRLTLKSKWDVWNTFRYKDKYSDKYGPWKNK